MELNYQEEAQSLNRYFPCMCKSIFHYTFVQNSFGHIIPICTTILTCMNLHFPRISQVQVNTSYRSWIVWLKVL